MIDRESAILLKFKEMYGNNEGAGLARAPGRVNIIGEHTDYNDGYVLPIAIARDTMVAFRPTDSRTVNVCSMAVDESAGFALDEEGVPAGPHWVSYAAGVARVLAEEGVDLVGADLVIHSTVPIGGGLSSSAALEVSLALAFTSMAGVELDKRTLATACRRAENEYAGMGCGIMDQYVALYGEAGSAVLLDCRSMSHELVSCPSDTAKFVVCDTGVRHELATTEYNSRRQECSRAVQGAARVLRDEPVHSLRDLGPGDLPYLEHELDPVIFRRARHVVTENARVIAAAESMREQNYIAMGVLMDASHESLREDFEVSCEELDVMVEIAWAQSGVFGARMTGGGFGGCTISLVDSQQVDTFCKNITAAYKQRTGIVPSVYVCAPENSAEVVRGAS